MLLPKPLIGKATESKSGATFNQSLEAEKQQHPRAVQRSRNISQEQCNVHATSPKSNATFNQRREAEKQQHPRAVQRSRNISQEQCNV
jgi:hypothetical protein